MDYNGWIYMVCADAPISAGFRSQLRLAMILFRKTAISKHWFECLRNFIRQLRSCFEFLQKVFLGLMYTFSCVFSRLDVFVS